MLLSRASQYTLQALIYPGYCTNFQRPTFLARQQYF
jgi:hypothetical protein